MNIILKVWFLCKKWCTTGWIAEQLLREVQKRWERIVDQMNPKNMFFPGFFRVIGIRPYDNRSFPNPLMRGHLIFFWLKCPLKARVSLDFKAIFHLVRKCSFLTKTLARFTLHALTPSFINYSWKQFLTQSVWLLICKSSRLASGT